MAQHNLLGPPAPASGPPAPGSPGGGPAAGTGPGGFGGALANVFEGAGGLFDAGQAQERIDDVTAGSQFQDQTGELGGFSFDITGAQTNVTLDAAGQAQQEFLQGRGQDLIGGGEAFAQGDFQQAVGGLQFQQGLQGIQDTSGGIASSAFGGLGSQFNQAQQGANVAAGAFAGGARQDFTGGAQQQFLGAGAANLQGAANQGQLRGDALSTLRSEVEGSGLLDTAINRLQNRQFGQGRLGSSGGAQETRQFLDAVAQQDRGLQSQAFGIANQQGQLQAGIGSSQAGLGLGLFGANQQAIQGFGGLAQSGLSLTAGIEGQQFGQNLGAAEFGRQGALNFQGAQQGLLGQGQQAFAQNAGVGLDALGVNLATNQQGIDLGLGIRNAEADRIQASGASSQALLSQSEGGAGSGIGSLIGGALGTAVGGPLGGAVGKFLGGLF